MQKQEQIFKKEVLRYPRLDTVLMIEKAIRGAKEHPTIRQAWLSLPKKVMWQTYLAVIDYLVYSNKIIIARDGKIVWIWDPDFVRDYLKNKSHLLVH